MFKSIKNSLFKGRVEDPKRLEKWIRKSIWQDVNMNPKNLNLDLDFKYLSKLFEFFSRFLAVIFAGTINASNDLLLK